jgi:hypothetical protein
MGRAARTGLESGTFNDQSSDERRGSLARTTAKVVRDNNPFRGQRNPNTLGRKEGHVRFIAITLCGMLMFVVSAAHAQESASPVSVESVRAVLQQSQQQPAFVSPPFPPWVKPGPTMLPGILTLAPPETSGQFVSVVVPVGELATRAARAVANAQHRRAERKAHEEVQRSLEEFQAQLAAR